MLADVKLCRNITGEHFLMDLEAGNSGLVLRSFLKQKRGCPKVYFLIWNYLNVSYNVKDIINPFHCFLKKGNFSIKTSNE